LPDNKNIILCIDRTNWKLGKPNINILMLSVAYQGLSIPILWTLLDKQGNSNTEERISIIGKFISLFGTSCIKHLLADREFISYKWLNYLKCNKINFYIRVKVNAQVKCKNGRKMAITRFFLSSNLMYISVITKVELFMELKFLYQQSSEEMKKTR